jgi:5-methyltetrahydrofolate--homocysteine methyltransferase
MTEMEKVIKLKEQKNLKVKVIVGGAPVTKSFAQSIKADAYAQDAISCAKQCSAFLS